MAFQEHADGWISKSGTFLVKDNVKEKRSAFCFSLCHKIDVEQKAIAGQGILTKETALALCVELDLLITEENEDAFFEELSGGGGTATTTMFGDWWARNTLLKTDASIAYARKAVKSALKGTLATARMKVAMNARDRREMFLKAGGGDDWMVSAGSKGGSRSTVFTESALAAEVAEPEPEAVEVARTRPPPPADEPPVYDLDDEAGGEEIEYVEAPRQESAERSAARVGYELEKLRAAKQALDIGLITQDDFDVMKQRFLGLQQAAAEMKDELEETRSDDKDESRPRCFARSIGEGMLECVFNVQEMLGINWEVKEDKDGNTFGDITALHVRDGSMGQECAVAPGMKLMCIGSGSDSLEVDGNDFDIVMKQLTAFRSFAYPLILTVALVESKYEDRTKAGKRDENTLEHLFNDRSRNALYRVAAQSLLPSAMHAGFLHCEESRKQRNQMTRFFVVLWRHPEADRHSNVALVLYKSSTSPSASHVYYLKPSGAGMSSAASKKSTASFKVSKPGSKRKGYPYCVRIDGTKAPEDVAEFKLVASTDQIELKEWEAVLHCIEQHHDNDKIRKMFGGPAGVHTKSAVLKPK